ncbi:MAG: membrane protein insertion efficiency factor YidD [Candidatus Roizmanbacteria bacterium]|nr:membrane protein insertion efficiency factor YidD [Candidatus Roizmanbacteria bacterium]
MKSAILFCIRFYQKSSVFQSHFLKTFFLTSSECRFEPTCSRYTYDAVEKYGSIKGLWLGIRRILSCHPWNKGGYDPMK